MAYRLVAKESNWRPSQTLILNKHLATWTRKQKYPHRAQAAQLFGVQGISSCQHPGATNGGPGGLSFADKAEPQCGHSAKGYRPG